MRLTKHAHSTVEIAADAGTILIDPSAFSPRVEDLLARADVILVTHAHADHVDPDGVRRELDARPDLVAYGPADVVDGWEDGSGRAVAVRPGDAFTAAGLAVTVHGGVHAEIYPGQSAGTNVGYLVGGAVFHPGDSFEVPDAAIDLLLVPISGPWMKVAEAAAFVDAVRPRRALAIHDALLSQVGHGLLDRHLGEGGVTSVPVRQVAPGESIEV